MKFSRLAAITLATVIMSPLSTFAAKPKQPDSAGAAPAVNKIEIQADAGEWAKAMTIQIDKATGLPNAHNERNKYELKKPVTVRINGGEAMQATLNTRGQNCMKSPRPCMGLKLIQDVNQPAGAKDKKMEFLGNGGLKSKNINMVSMWEDYSYVASKIAFELFKELKLFEINTEYSEVIVNGKSYGLFLLTEKPKKVAEKAVEKTAGKDAASIVARRKFSGNLELDEDDVKSGDPVVLANLERFKSAYSQLQSAVVSKGPQGDQRDSISRVVNLELYMQWLIVNSLLKNGDYTDEVYVYADMTQKNVVFNIMPWDLDGAFARSPHEGFDGARGNDLRTGLLFSYESAIDRVIVDNPALKTQLKITAKKLLGSISDETFDVVVNRVKDAITPYLDNQAVLDGGIYDRANGRKPYTKDMILNTLKKRSTELKARKAELLPRAN